MNADRVVEVLEEIALLLELKGENPFKARAYINAARALETLAEPLETIVAEHRLGGIKGLGDALQQKITELVTTGRLDYHEKLKASFPPNLLTLLRIPGLGPKKVKVLHERLGVGDVDQLQAACERGAVAALEGFGEKTQAKILEGIEFQRRHASHHHLHVALALGGRLLEQVRGHPATIRCSLAGSLRRSKEVVGDVDVVASSAAPGVLIDFFCELPEVASVRARGETKASVVCADGLQADLRVVSDQEYPFALAYFTGSKEHNIVMRRRAIERGLRLNEYGLFRSEEETRDPKLLVPCATEEAIFAELGLDAIPPELREDAGEFGAAVNHTLPRLLEWTDLRGSLHNHSQWSDGRQTLEEIAAQALELGCDYWAITDHSKSSFQAHGLTPERLAAQLEAIGKLNRQLARDGHDLRLLTGSEVDILSGGRLDFDNELLARLEVVVASIHQGFSGGEEEMTRRLIRAAENPHVHILGHLTGRLLLEREGYKVHHAKIIDACAATGTWIELNASPHRFDMDWRFWRLARDKGVGCVINADAHHPAHAGYLRLGAAVARKGWLTKQDVINTRPLPALLKLLEQKRTSQR